MEDLEGKTAFITGGASGIGLGIGKTFVGAGMNVVLADLRQDHIDQAIEYFESIQKGRNVHAIKLDVTDRAAYEKAADEAEAKFGGVDILVNNAGVGIEGSIKDASWNDWDWGVGVNLGGPINGIKIFVPRMIARGKGGHIVTTSSLAGIMPGGRDFAIYSSTKAALVSLSEAMRAELEEHDIGVSVLCPGAYKTNIREAKDNRPDKFKGETGYGERLDKLSKREDAPQWSDPLDAGEKVLKAVKNNELYIITHGEMKAWAEDRYKAILDAFPPPDPKYDLETDMKAFSIQDRGPKPE